MKAILIDPWQKSIEAIKVKSSMGSGYSASLLLHELHELVGEDTLDFRILTEGESILVGDHSALHDPPLPCFELSGALFYGRAVVLGYNRGGTERDTQLTPDDISRLIVW